MTPPDLANPTYRGATCRGCNAPIAFVRTEKGRQEPLERETTTIADTALEPSALRLVAIIDGQPKSIGLKRAQELGVTVSPRTVVHVPHFATCPTRDRFRRDRG